ncbi:MAG: hypothetical protein V1760_00510, partial [Candidatus Peregrinibacteria bacterium]
MKKLAAILLFVSSVALMGCKVETTTSFGIDIEDTQFALVGEGGSLIPAEDPTFNLGDEIAYILKNVGPFKEGEDGLNWFDMSMVVTGPDGNEVLKQENMLGDNGRLKLPDNYASSPYGIFTSTAELAPGDYKI